MSVETGGEVSMETGGECPWRQEVSGFKEGASITETGSLARTDLGFPVQNTEWEPGWFENTAVLVCL